MSYLKSICDNKWFNFDLDIHIAHKKIEITTALRFRVEHAPNDLIYYPSFAYNTPSKK
jgi:hypothetical protein